jgi:hypothetical protein
VCNPGGYDEEASVDGATGEWDEKYGADCDQMYWEDFFDEIFEMVDLWTNRCDQVREDFTKSPCQRR